MTYTSILKSLTRSVWRWPLVPFVAVALFALFTAVCVVDAFIGAAWLALMLASALLLGLAWLFDPALHASLRKRFTDWLGAAATAIAQHPNVVATLRNPRWWVALPAWAFVVPPLLAWAVVRGLCAMVVHVIRTVDAKLGEWTDRFVLRHMRRMYAWVFGAKS